ncbi:IclR family transcriptional regulator [Diplocloster hominis]|uniref:IclR family transcriptional regulator n=1 Tax=Diplocloster hominis TaxID=3079010 RepID=UPI0031BA441A
MNESNIYPPAVDRAIQILDYMAQNHEPQTIKNLSSILGIPNASLFRIVKCLTDHNYLRLESEQPDRYVLGYKLYCLAQTAYDGSPLGRIAMPHMKKLAEQTQQAAQLCVLQSGTIITIEQVIPSNATITIIAKLGEKIPVNLSASGKILFSLLPEAKQKALIPTVTKSLKKSTAKTVCEINPLLEEIRATRDRGYGTDIECYATGIGCIAVPLFDYTSNPVAALNLTGPIDRYTDPDSARLLLSNLITACQKISSALGYSQAGDSYYQILK